MKIPRCLKISSRYQDNNIDIIRRKLRKNKICHQSFNPSLDNIEGRRYYSGVYKANESVMSYSETEIKNLYEFLVTTGLYKSSDKIENITHLRTGYDPKE